MLTSHQAFEVQALYTTAEPAVLSSQASASVSIFSSYTSPSYKITYISEVNYISSSNDGLQEGLTSVASVASSYYSS